MVEKLKAARTVCPRCSRSSRPKGLYCVPCWQAQDMHPSDFDMDLGRQSCNVVVTRATALQARITSGRARHDIMTEVLWSGTLTEQEFKTWELYCDGSSEEKIAATIGWSRQKLYEKVIGPLRKRCGLPTRTYRYARKGQDAAQAT
jgi:hypothetical protein